MVQESQAQGRPEVLRIAGREGFRSALREALAEAGDARWRELWLCSPDFADWPLNEVGVIDSLTRWAGAQRRLHLLAIDYEELRRRHPRFVQWRVSWSHLIEARALPELQAVDFSTLLLAPGAISLRLLDPLRHQGRVSRLAADLVADRELIDVISQRSVEAFAATTLGL